MTYFVQDGSKHTRHMTIKVAVARVNYLINRGHRGIGVWLHGCYGPPDLTISGESTVTVTEVGDTVRAALKAKRKADLSGVR